MFVKDFVRPIPGVRRLSRLRQRLAFADSASFWERKYNRGENSGPGSYGEFGAAKAEFLNAFVREHAVETVTEFGCGDGYQLSLAKYPKYVGLDVSRKAIDLCRRRFENDPSKSFFFFDSDYFVDSLGLFGSDLAISLDVIYHLVEDAKFATYMSHLFSSARRFVIIYSTNASIPDDAAHVTHRHFTPWVEEHSPELAAYAGRAGAEH